MTYASRPERLPAANPKLKIIECDVSDSHALQRCWPSDATAIFHLAAESHVDRSITDPGAFIRTNVLGTGNILELSRTSAARMLYCSTDEVYGSIAAPGLFTEHSPLRPSSPYSASKASGDLLCLGAHTTYGQDVVITRCSNNFGVGQHPEKLIPLVVKKALRGEALPIYGDGLQVRDWMAVEDHVLGLNTAFLNGDSGRVYNLGANFELTNLELVSEMLETLGLQKDLISHVADRLGHDRRYALDASRAQRELGWQPSASHMENLRDVFRQLAQRQRTISRSQQS